MARMQVKSGHGFSGVLDDGTEVAAQMGETFPADHPAVKKWPEFFEPSHSRFDPEPVAEASSEPPVEDATAEPGRKRGKG